MWRRVIRCSVAVEKTAAGNPHAVAKVGAYTAGGESHFQGMERRSEGKPATGAAHRPATGHHPINATTLPAPRATYATLCTRSRERRLPRSGLVQPSKKRRQRFLAETKAWLKKNMHGHPRFQQRKRGEKLCGFNQYFGLRYCKPALQSVRKQVERSWKRILERRSERGNRTWKQWKLKPWFRLPAPRLRRSKRPRRLTEAGNTPSPAKENRRSYRTTEAGTKPRPVKEDRQMPLFPGLARA